MNLCIRGNLTGDDLSRGSKLILIRERKESMNFSAEAAAAAIKALIPKIPRLSRADNIERESAYILNTDIASSQ